MTALTQVFEYVAHYATHIAIFSSAMSFTAVLFTIANAYKTASSIRALKNNIEISEKYLNIDIEKLKYNQSKKIISYLDKMTDNTSFTFSENKTDEVYVFLSAFEKLDEVKKRKFVNIIRNEGVREKRKILESLFADEKQRNIFIRH